MELFVAQHYNTNLPANTLIYENIVNGFFTQNQTK